MIGDKWLSIRSDRKKDLSYSEMARRHNIDRRTAKAYCESDIKPKYTYKIPKKKKIDDYAAYIDELLNEAPYSAVRIKEQAIGSNICTIFQREKCTKYERY